MSNSSSETQLEPLEKQLPPQARLLEVARELFCRDGIHATGIDRILAEANVSKMTLYTRYGSKEALLRAVLQREGEEWRARLFEALEAHVEPLAKLEGIVPALRGWFESGRFYGCAFMNAVAEHRKDEVWLRELASSHHKEILGCFSAAAQAAGFAAPAVLARQLLLMMDGAISALMVSGDPAVLDVCALNVKAILATAPREAAAE